MVALHETWCVKDFPFLKYNLIYLSPLGQFCSILTALLTVWPCIELTGQKTFLSFSLYWLLQSAMERRVAQPNNFLLDAKKNIMVVNKSFLWMFWIRFSMFWRHEWRFVWEAIPMVHLKFSHICIWKELWWKELHCCASIIETLNTIHTRMCL